MLSWVLDYIGSISIFIFKVSRVGTSKLPPSQLSDKTLRIRCTYHYQDSSHYNRKQIGLNVTACRAFM